MKATINSQIEFGGQLASFNENTVKSEPMLHRADRGFAIANGGLITSHFISSLSWDDDILIDSRSSMLMENFYPCIPGFHHDDVPREREDKQPNYFSPSYKSEHVMAIWGDCSKTEFALGRHEIDIPEVGHKIYKELDPVIEEECNNGKLFRIQIPERQLIYFNWQSWHRGMPATKRGFRFFIRATRKSGLKARNEIRVNANVYMKDLSEGW